MLPDTMVYSKKRPLMHCESEWLCVGVKGIEGAGMLTVGNEKGGEKTPLMVKRMSGKNSPIS